jgi:hypothetical protein
VLLHQPFGFHDDPETPANGFTDAGLVPLEADHAPANGFGAPPDAPAMEANGFAAGAAAAAAGALP